MADVYGPFATAPWSDGEWSRFAPTWAPSGPIGTGAASATTGDWAFANTGLSVSAGTGRAWVRGFGITRTGTPATHTVTANTHASFSRRDRLVLRRDLAAGTVTTAVKAGTAASSPTVPSLTQVEAGVWEEALFSFLVPPNSGTTITGVIDERRWVSPDGGGWLDQSASTLRLSSTVDASETSTGHGLQIGPDNGLNLAIDGNEIVPRNSGALSTLGVGFARIVAVGDPTTADNAATKGYVDTGRRFMRAQRIANNDAFPNNAWTTFGSDTSWTATDPHGMRGTGGTLVAPWDGWYDIDATIHWGPNSTGSRGLALQPAAGVDIGEGAGVLLYLGYVQASASTVLSGGHKMFLSAGQTVQIAGFQNSGAGTTVATVRFSVEYGGNNA